MSKLFLAIVVCRVSFGQRLLRHQDQRQTLAWQVGPIEPPWEMHDQSTDSAINVRRSGPSDAYLERERERDREEAGLWKKERYLQSYQRECQPTAEAQVGWTAYRNFHSQCRQNISCMKRALIWSCKEADWTCGGLGDELKGLAFTFYAALASKRPFFVEWEKMGQDVLQFFANKDIDVRIPDTLPTNCSRNQYLFHPPTSRKMLETLMDTAQNDLQCLTWVTNYFPSHLFLGSNADVLHSNLPWLEHVVKPIYAVGCAMGFLFQAEAQGSQLLARDSSFSKLPQNYSLVHFRVPDATIAALAEDDFRLLIQQALDCAHKKSNGLPIVFLAGSQAAKNLALQVSSGQVIVTNGTAMHIGENHHLGSTNQLIDGVFQDFWTALGTQYLFAGRRLSGLSLTAASMSFLPQDHVFDTHCKASWESDNFENLGMP